MKNYLVFYGDIYHPLGGMQDFVESYDSIEEAIAALESAHKKNRPCDKNWDWSWGSIWSLIDKKEVYKKGYE